jgi:hypothetical protein
VGYVSDDSAKFGEYNGMDELGAYVVADADGRYRGKDGLWLDLSAVDLGWIRVSSASRVAGKGDYQLHLSYKQLSHKISDSAVSLFLGIGTTSLTRPPAGSRQHHGE